MWGTSWRQRLRLAPLHAAVAIADSLAALMPARTEAAGGAVAARRDRDHSRSRRPRHARASARVTGGCAARRHRAVADRRGRQRRTRARRTPALRRASATSSGSTTTRRSGSRARSSAASRSRAHGATYLLNNDMTVEPEAIVVAPAAARRAHLRDRLADFPAGRHRPSRGDGLHRLVRRSRRRAPVSRPGPGDGCARNARLRKRRRRALSHGAASPVSRRQPRLRSVLLGRRRVGRARLARRLRRPVLSRFARRAPASRHHRSLLRCGRRYRASSSATVSCSTCATAPAATAPRRFSRASASCPMKASASSARSTQALGVLKHRVARRRASAAIAASTPRPRAFLVQLQAAGAFAQARSVRHAVCGVSAAPRRRAPRCRVRARAEGGLRRRAGQRREVAVRRAQLRRFRRAVRGPTRAARQPRLDAGGGSRNANGRALSSRPSRGSKHGAARFSSRPRRRRARGARAARALANARLALDPRSARCLRRAATSRA